MKTKRKEENTKKRKQAPKKQISLPKKLKVKDTEERIREVLGEDAKEENFHCDDDGMVDDDIENHDDMNDEREDEGENNSIKSGIEDMRSRKSKKLDWIQGFFYLPKFDCYLPRPVFHEILNYIQPFPYYLTLRGVCQQWLDELYQNIFPNVKEMNLVKRHEFEDSINYKYPWYNKNAKNTYSSCIRYLALLFPNVEVISMPLFTNSGWYSIHELHAPNQFIYLFRKLTKLCLFSTTPFDESHYGRQLFIKLEFFDFEEIMDAYPDVIRDINKLLRHSKDTDICKPYTLDKSSDRTVFFEAIKHLVLQEKFSFEHMDLFSMKGIHFSKEIIDFFVDNYRKHSEHGYKKMYPYEEYFNPHGILTVKDDVADYILEKEMFKIAFSHAVTNDEIAFTIVGKILCNVSSLSVAKAIFEQAKFPVIFEQEVNPLLVLLNNNYSREVPAIIELLCSLYPLDLLTLGDSNGNIIKNVDGQFVHEFKLLYKYIENKGSRCSGEVIKCLYNLGFNLHYVDPVTNDNLLHICPIPYLFEVLPTDFLLMKNKDGMTPIHTLLSQNSSIGTKDLYVGLSSLTCTDFIEAGVDPNAIDNSKKTPLHYYVHNEHKDYDVLVQLGNRMSSNALNQEDENGKLAFTYLIEDLLFKRKPETYTSRFVPLSQEVEQAVQRLIETSCDVQKVFQAISISITKQGDPVLNGALSLISLINYPLRGNSEKAKPMLITLCKELAKIRDETLDKLLVRKLDFSHIELDQSLRNVPINALSMLLCVWCKFPQPVTLQNWFKGENAILSDRLFSNIFDTDNGLQCDFIYYFLAGRFNLTKFDSYVSGFYGYLNSWQGFQYFTTQLKNLTFVIPNYGELNIFQLCCKLDNYAAFRHFASQKPYRAQEFVDLIAENGDSFGPFIDEYPSVKWKPEHIITALKNHHYSLCFKLISTYDELLTTISLEEIVEIICGCTYSSNDIVNFDMQAMKLLDSVNITEEERLNLFSKQRIIYINDTYEELDKSTDYWHRTLVETLKTNKLIFEGPSRVQKTMSLMEICYLFGLYFVAAYFITNSSNTKQRGKKLFTKTDIKQETVLEWLSRKNTVTYPGFTLAHLVCTFKWPSNLAQTNQAEKNKVYLAQDLIQYLKDVKRIDILNIKDDDGETPLFMAYRNRFMETEFSSVIDTEIVNNDGEKAEEVVQNEE
ncbi:hypothetical protein C9374_001798 [Naegleria lovaniensis]|uniref:Uncharacterized protein n=1 Tax=Naegleria lovaniensis TaxID=51637 RepID=A0AA88GSB0_NAELO|nr:uncharacterized protein C9374_001798 [Naegleria lovaniensis]KAG2387466.1 hypothetical protein C9374_001798 [Naegleria lovaniensis]